MAAVISGEGLGLYNLSLNTIGTSLGQGAQVGRQGNQVYINVSTGNLVVRQRDEFLTGTGLDLNLTRTYNSLGVLDGDNNDNWRLSVYQRLDFSGAANTAGSTIIKTNSDGSQSLFTYDASLGYYVSTDGDGAHDTIKQEAGNWIWSAGDNTVSETYDSSGRLLSVQDSDGHSRGYVYNTAGLITQITDSSGQTVNLVYSGTNLQRIETISAGVTQTRVHYGYDASNRLETVSVDLSPEDNIVADGNTFATTYTYDGASNRIASIAHSDGSAVSFTYDANNRVDTITEGTGADAKTTRYEYDQTTQQQVVNIANPAILKNTVVENRVIQHVLNPNQLSLQSYSNQHWSQDFSAGTSGLTALPPSMVQENGGLTLNASGGIGSETIYGKRSYDYSAGVTFRYEFNTQQIGDSAEIWIGIDSVDGGRQHNLLIKDGNLIAKYHNASGYLIPETLGAALPNTDYVLEFETGPSGSTMYLYEKGTSRAQGYTQHSANTNFTSEVRSKLGVRAWGSLGTAVVSIDNIAEFTRADNAQSYVIQANDTWDTIAINLYGDSAVAEELRAALGNPELTAGHFLSGFPAEILDSTTEVLLDGQVNTVLDLDALWSQDFAANASGLSLLSAEIAHETGQLRLATQAGYGERIAAQGDRIYSMNDGVTYRFEATPLQMNTPGLIYLGIRSVDGSRGHRLSFKNGMLEVSFWANGYWRLDQLGVAKQNTRYVIEVETHAEGSTLYVYEHGTSRSMGYAHSIATTDYTGGVRTEMGMYSSSSWAQAETLVHNISETTGSGQQVANYTVQVNDSWENIAAIAYGNSQVAGALQAAMGNPVLTTGTVLSGLPASLSYDVSQTVTATVASYYEVQAGDSWQDITQAVYGTTDPAAVEALQTAMGSPVLTANKQLTTPTSLKYSTLTTGAVNTTSVVDPLGRISSYVFDTEGKLVEVLSPALAEGQRLSTRYEYDAQDNVSRVIDGRGNAVDYLYNDAGLLVRQQDAAGNVVQYSYNSDNLLQNRTVYLSPDPDGAGDIQAADPQTTRNAYDSEGHLRFTVSADGSVIENRYDAAGNLTATLTYTQDLFDTSGLGVDDVLDLAQMESWAANPARDLTKLERTDYSYDFRGNLASTTSYSATLATGAGDATTASTTYYIYDQAGQLIKSIDPRGTANSNTGFVANNYETHYIYDGFGRVTQTTDALGYQTSTVYNDAGQRIETTLANGLIRTTVYDARGQVISLSEHDPANLAVPLSETRSVYDDSGRLRAVQDANGVIVHTIYDAAGRMVATIDGTGALVENVYDENDQVIRQIAYATLLDDTTLAGLVNIDAQGALISANAVPLEVLRPAEHVDDRSQYNFYDEAGRLVFEIDGEAYVTEYVYDGAGQLTDSIRHSTPFPGLINNSDANAQITVTDTNTLIQWLNGSVPANNQISTTIVEEETGNAINVDLTVNTDATTGNVTASGTVSTTRAPVQPYDNDNFATTDTRTQLNNTETIANQHLTVETSGAYQVNRTTAYQTTVRSLELGVNNQPDSSNVVSRDSSGVTVSGVALPGMSGYSGPFLHFKVILKRQEGSAWRTLNHYTTTSSSATRSFSNPSLEAGNYRITVERIHENMYHGGTAVNGSADTGFTVGNFNGSRLTVMTVGGASSIDFYHRPAGSNANYVQDEEHWFVLDIAGEYDGQTRDFKVVYRNSSNAVIGVGVGQFTVTEDTQSVHGFTYYDLTATANGTYLENVLTSAEVGDLGDGLSTTLGYVDTEVFVSGTNTLVSTARTYPNVVQAVTGSAPVNLSMDSALADGVYDVVINKYRPDGSFVGTQNVNSLQIGQATAHVQELTWSANVQTLTSSDRAIFYYRPQTAGNTQPYTAVAFDGVTDGLQTYFTQQGGQYKVRLHDLDPAINYEYYVEYRAVDQGLLQWSGTEDTPHILNVNSSGSASVNFSNYEDVATASGGTRLVGVFSNEEIQPIDYISVDVVDTVTNTVVHNDVLTIPGAQENYLGSLNLTQGAELADGRYRIEVTRHFKDETITPRFDHFIYEVGMQPAYNLMHSNAVDNGATQDTLSIVTDYAALSTIYSVDTTPPDYAVDRTGAYSTTQHTPLSLIVVNTVGDSSANVTQSGATTTVSGVQFVTPSGNNTWQIHLSKKDPDGIFRALSGYPTSATKSTTSPNSHSFSNLEPGEYRLRTETYGAPPPGWPVPIPSGNLSTPTYFTVGGQPLGGQVHIPTVTGAARVDFYHRPASVNGPGGYTLAPDHDFSVFIAPEFDNTFRDYRIDYKNSAGQVIAVSNGTFLSGTGTANQENISVYSSSVTAVGTTIPGVLSSAEVGDFDTDQLSALRYVDATVYLAGTSTVVSTARTYPGVMKMVHGINDGRINLSLDSALADGYYDVVIDKYYNNNTSTMAAQTLSNVKLGNFSMHFQDLRWPANAVALGSSDTVSFSYRESGATTFTSLPMSTAASGNSYFVRDGADFHVRLYDINPNTHYEYYIEYRDAAGGLIKTAGSAGNPLILDADVSGNSSIALNHTEVSSSSPAVIQHSANVTQSGSSTTVSGVAFNNSFANLWLVHLEASVGQGNSQSWASENVSFQSGATPDSATFAALSPGEYRVRTEHMELPSWGPGAPMPSGQLGEWTYFTIGSRPTGDLSVFANDNGTRLTAYLTTAEAAATDYLSVDVIDDVSGQPVYTDVLTIPRAQANYDGGLNLSPRMELLPGRYRIEVTRFFNDSALVPQLSNFIHEVTVDTDNSQALNVEVVGDQVRASYSGNLLAATGLNLSVDLGANSIGLDLQQLIEGPYSYTQRVTDTTDSSYTEDSGRLAVYSGGTPDIDALRDFYSRNRTVEVEVGQTQYARQREPVLPNGYTLVTSTQGTTTAQQSTPVTLTTLSETVDSSNVIDGQYIDVSHITMTRPVNNHYFDTTGDTVWEHFKVVDRETGRVVYEAEKPSLTRRSVTAPNTSGYLRQEPTPTEFDVTRFSTGRYQLVVQPVRISSINIGVPHHLLAIANYVGPAAVLGQPGVTFTEFYSWGSSSTIDFDIDLPDTATVSWPLSSQPADTTVSFKYASIGFSPIESATVISQNGQLQAQIANGDAGVYNYLIEYRNGAGDVVKSSSGQFEIIANQQTTSNEVFIEDVVVAGDISNGTSLISSAHNRSDIESIEARVYDAVTGVLVSGPEMTYPQLISGYAGQVNLQSGTQLSQGRYRVELLVTSTSGAQVSETPFLIEVGQQQELNPATEISWDATKRPRNTDVYFRYKTVADAEYDPKNLWIRATASQTIQGEYYVRFPQMTPDGQLLDPLAVGDYDYMVIYVDRDTGKEVESALGQFSVIHDNGRVDAHQLNFGRDLEGRQDRLFYNDRGQVIASLNALGYLTENIYDAAGRLLETIQYATQSIQSDWQQGSLDRLRPAASAEDLHSHNRYDAQGRLVLEVNAERYVTEYVYNVEGNLESMIGYANRTTAIDLASASIAELRPLASADDRTMVSYYTARNQVEFVGQRVGNNRMSETLYEYDVMGQVIKTTTRNVGAIADERTVSSRYDLQGREVAVLNGMGNQALADLLASKPAVTQAEIDAIWSEYGVQSDYDAVGQQTRLTDQNGNNRFFYYDERGNIRYSINALGEVEELIYNNFGQVSHTIQYANRLENAQLAGLIGGLLTQETKATLSSLRDPEHDSVVEQGYDHRGLVISQQDPLGNETHMQYNAFSELRFERQTLKGGVTDGIEYRVEHIYDALGRKTNIIAGANGNDINQGFDFDAFGRVVNGYNYDSNGDLYNHYANVHDKLGRVTETLQVIDSAAPMLRSVNGFTYDAFGRKLTQTDASGSVTTYSYDDINRSLTVITPEGISTTTKTNVHGETVEVTNGEGQATLFDYDANGQLINTTDAEGNTLVNEYDAAGRLIKETDANGIAVRIEYDAVDRVTKRVVDPTLLNESGVVIYQGLNLETSFAYDSKGQVLTTTDPEGVITETRYDNKGQLVSVIVDPAPEVDDGRDHLSLATFYSYDSRGNRLSVNVGREPGVVNTTDDTGNLTQEYIKALNSTQYEYDLHGRLAREVTDPTITWTDADGVEHTITGINTSIDHQYDGQGNLAVLTNARGFSTRYVHDSFGKLIYTIVESGNDRGQVSQNFYNADDQLVKVTQYAQTVDLYGVDSVLGLAEAQALVSGLSSNQDRAQQQVFDQDSRLLYIISPTGLVTENVYDDNGRIIQTINYSEVIATADYVSQADVEAALLVAADGKPEQRAWSVYDARGLALYNIDSLGYVTANTFDDNGNLLRSVQYANALDTAILNDAISNRQQLDTLIPTLADSQQDRVTRFAYDAANRQVYQLDALGYVSESRYDDMGRVIGHIAYADQYTIASEVITIAQVAGLLPVEPGAADRVTLTAYDAASRIVATRDAEGGEEYFQYDLAGNNTAYTNAKGDTWHYQYDAANRMIEQRSPEVAVTRLDATVWQQTFDADLSGITGSLTASAANYSLVDQRLSLIHSGSGSYELAGSELYQYDRHLRFETTVTTGADISVLELSVGAENSTGTAQHGLLISGGRLYAQYNNGSLVDLGAAQAYTNYIIEVETSADNSTLWVYQAGQSRGEGFKDVRSADSWVNNGNNIQWQAAFTSNAAVVGDAAHIDNVRVLMSQERALMDEGVNLSSQTVFEPIITRIEYNAMGDVTARTEAAGTSDERRTEYVYDALNRQVSTVHPEVGVYSYADANANYTGSRQETREVLSSHSYFDVLGNEVVGVDTAGNRSYKVYDGNGRLVYDVDANGYVTENRYDAFGNVTELVRYATAIALPTGITDAANPGLTVSDLTGSGPHAIVTSNSDRVFTTEYDLLNRVSRVVQPEVAVAAIDVDGNATVSNASPIIANKYNAFGQLIKQSTLANGNTWLDSYFYYDANGNRIMSVDPEGYATEVEYDSGGNIERQIEYATPLDLLANPISTSVIPNPVVDIDSKDRETNYTYDGLNRKVTETQVGVTYSQAGVTGAGTGAYDATFSQVTTNLTMAYEYDAVGNIVATTDVGGNVSYQFYDALGRLTGETSVSRSQQQSGISLDTALFVDNAGTADAALRWSRPPIPGLTAELRVRSMGATSWTALTVVDTGTALEAVIGALPSDQYEYELDYRRVGQAEVYASASGEVNVVTSQSTGSLGLAYQVQDSGDTLLVSGNTTGLTSVLINGVSYAAVSLGNGEYSVNLSALARGNYSFTTQGAVTELSGQVQKITGALGGEFAIQTTDVDIQYEVTKRASYVVTGKNKGHWQSNRLVIDLPLLQQLGTADIQYEVVVEFSNAHGDRKSRTYTGNASSQRINISTPGRLDAIQGLRYHGRMEDVVSIKLWRGDADTVTYTERPNFDAIYNPGRYNFDYSPIVEWSYGRRDLVIEATGGVDTQQLEFINLPDGSEPGEAESMTARFSYRLQGSSDTWITKDLHRIGQGYFSIGNRDIPAGIYEYEVRINGSNEVIQSGQNLAIGNGISGYESISQSAVSGDTSQAINTPLTTYKRDAFGNSVHTTLHANSAQFDNNGNVSVLADSARDQNIYTYYDSHGNMVQLQDAEGNSHFYSYDHRGNLAKEWQWITVPAGQAVSGGKLFTGEVYRYDAVGQQTETITIAETMDTEVTSGIYNRNYALANNQVEYNSFGEVVSRGLNGGAQEYFDYDNAGRLWRTNSGDGVDKIHLYDLQGNTVQSLSSQGRDLSQAAYDYSQLAVTAALSSDIQKSSFFYDKLGRVVRQMEPSRTQDTTTFTPDSTITMDRWGNILRYIDAAGIASEFVYDRLNNRIQQTQAVGVGVTVVGEDGQDQLAVTPTSYGYYDLFGRMVGGIDANGNERVMEYDEAGQLSREIAADGGIKRHNYDNFGFEVETVMYAGAEGSTPLAVTKIYDGNGRVVNEYLPNGGEAIYVYNEAGNRTEAKRLVSIAGNGDRRYEVTLYAYDSRGNLIEEKINARIEVYAASGAEISIDNNPEPVTRRYRYDLQNNKIAEQRYLDFSTAQQINASWQYDYFGRLIDHIDFGGGDYDYSYNFAGQLTQEDVLRGTASASKVYDYYEDGSLRSLTRGTLTNRYEYDIQGRLTDEYSNDGALYHNHYEYDALNRLTRMTGDGGSSLIFSGNMGSIGRGYYVDMSYAYDALGNRRRVHGVEGKNPGYNYFISTGGPTPMPVTVDGRTGIKTVDQWYTYDAENRVRISRGILQGNDIDGYQITVDPGQQFGSSLDNAQGSIEYFYDKTGKRIEAQYYRDNTLITENHYYDAVGNVIATTENGVGQYTSERTYDFLGRVTTFTAYSSPGTKSEIRESLYNDNGQLAQMIIYGINGIGQKGDVQVNVRYDYLDSYDNDGSLKHYSSTYTSGGTSNYTYNYAYYESAVADAITGTNRGANTTTHIYDAFGSLLSVSNSNSDMSKNNISYTLNAAGQVVHKRIGNGSSNQQHQFYYYSNGRAIGTGGHREVDFDYTGTPLSNASGVAQSPGSYIVRAGDTLQGIAMAVYGDAQRWYLIADANGLSGDADLIEGQSLRIPGQVSSLRNSSDAFRVFGQSDIIGDTTPQVQFPSIAAPIIYDIKPEKSNAFIVILAIIVAIVVTIYTQGALAKEGWTLVAAAMAGAAVGNIAGQMILIAGGEQDGFDWGSLATDVITAGITTGITQGINGADKAVKGVQQGQKAAQTAQKVQQALRTVGTAIINNMVSQGIAIALGQQEEFSWTSLATSAIMAPISADIDSGVGETEGFSKFGERFVGGLVKGSLSQGIQIMLEGGGQMDWASIAANAFGSALGNSMVGEMKFDQTTEEMESVGVNTRDPASVEEFYQTRKTIQQKYGLDQQSETENEQLNRLTKAAMGMSPWLDYDENGLPKIYLASTGKDPSASGIVFPGEDYAEYHYRNHPDANAQKAFAVYTHVMDAVDYFIGGGADEHTRGLVAGFDDSGDVFDGFGLQSLDPSAKRVLMGAMKNNNYRTAEQIAYKLFLIELNGGVGDVPYLTAAKYIADGIKEGKVVLDTAYNAAKDIYESGVELKYDYVLDEDQSRIGPSSKAVLFEDFGEGGLVLDAGIEQKRKTGASVTFKFVPKTGTFELSFNAGTEAQQTNFRGTFDSESGKVVFESGSQGKIGVSASIKIEGGQLTEVFVDGEIFGSLVNNDLTIDQKNVVNNEHLALSNKTKLSTHAGAGGLKFGIGVKRDNFTGRYTLQGRAGAAVVKGVTFQNEMTLDFKSLGLKFGVSNKAENKTQKDYKIK